MASTKTLNEVRDELEANSKDITPAQAVKIFEKPFSDFLEKFSKDARNSLFEHVRSETQELLSGKDSWPMAFNSYVELLTVAQAVNAEYAPAQEENLSELGLEVYQAGNRLGMLFFLFRKNKDISEADGRSMLQGAYPTALNGLTEEARAAIFAYAYERGSSNGWSQVAEDYGNLLDLMLEFKANNHTVKNEA